MKIRLGRSRDSTTAGIACLVLVFGCIATPPRFTSMRDAPVEMPPEESVRPWINLESKGPFAELLVRAMEAEDREIFAEREALAALTGPREGSVIADIGASSGFMVELFSGLVGPDGKVYAVDISAKLMQRLAENANEKGLRNIETVVCSERSVDLPANSVDLVFVCDTYHHFEFPKSTMRSIYDALKPGGQLVVVDFHRIAERSRPWVLWHVRAGEEVVTQEIIDVGFELINTHYVPFLSENYVLRFCKPGGLP